MDWGALTAYAIMKRILQFESLSLFGLSILLFSLLSYSWWVYPLLLLTPDIGMIGYLVSAKVGACTYNFTHSFTLGIFLYAVGMLFVTPALGLAGIIIIGHAGMDRFFGFGLKHTDSFKHTHLGWIGQGRG